MNKIEICNYALSRVGASPITDLPPAEDTEDSRRCDWMLRVILESILSEHNWKFAQKELALSQLSGVTSEMGSYIYSLPGDCLRPIDVLPLGHTDTWHVIGSTVVCNYSSATLLYMSKDLVNGPYPPWFGRAVAAELAAQLGPALSREFDYIGFMQGEARSAMDVAKVTDSNQGNVYRPTDHDPSTDSFVTGNPHTAEGYNTGTQAL